MAAIPTLDGAARPTPQPAATVTSITPQMSRVGDIVATAGRDLENAANVIADTNMRQDQMTAQDAANRLVQQGISLQNDPESGFTSVKGGGAVKPEFVTQYRDKFKDATTSIRDGLANDNQRRIFMQHAQVAGLKYDSALMQHQSRQTDIFNDATENSTIDLARRQIFQSYSDPDAFKSSLAQIDWAIDKKSQRQGWPAEAVTNVKAQYLEKIYEDVASLMVEQDPASALALMNKRVGVGGQPAQFSGNLPIDSLDANKLVSLRHRAAAYLSAEANRNRAEEDRRLADALKATNELVTFANEGSMPTPGYEQQVLAAVTGTPYEQQAREVLTMAYRGGAFGSQTLPRQTQTIRAMEARASTGTDPAEMVMLKQIRAIHEQQTKAYTENPWAAWTKYARGPAVPEAPINGAGDALAVIQQRLPAMDQLESTAGHPVSPLQPAEATKLSQHLQKMPPPQRADAIAALSTGLSLPRLEALSEQLGKNDKPTELAFKLGSDQTSAGRATSELVLRGAQALKDKTVKRDDVALTGWRTEIANLVRGTLGDEKAEQDVIDSAYFVRAAMDAESTPIPGYKLEASNRQAVKLVVGEPLERAGVKTILPRAMDENTFTERLRAYTPEKLRDVVGPDQVVYVRGQARTLDQLSSALPTMGMRRTGKGDYVPVSNGVPITIDKEGTAPLVLKVQ